MFVLQLPEAKFMCKTYLLPAMTNFNWENINHPWNSACLQAQIQT